MIYWKSPLKQRCYQSYCNSRFQNGKGNIIVNARSVKYLATTTAICITAYQTAFVALMVLALGGCKSSTAPGSTTNSQKAAVQETPAPFAVGGNAYVRVRSYTILSGEPTIKDLLGGTGYAIKNRVSGLEAVLTKPTAKDVSFSFGEPVTLIEKKDGPPELWHVSKDSSRHGSPHISSQQVRQKSTFLKSKT